MRIDLTYKKNTFLNMAAQMIWKKISNNVGQGAGLSTCENGLYWKLPIAFEICPLKLISPEHFSFMHH